MTRAQTRAFSLLVMSVAAACNAARAAGAELTVHARNGANLAYCGPLGGGLIQNHPFLTGGPVHDTISLSHPGGGSAAASSVTATLESEFGADFLLLAVNGRSHRGAGAGPITATCDGRDAWELDLDEEACFRLEVTLQAESTEASTPSQAYSFSGAGGMGTGAIGLSDGSHPSGLSHSLLAPGTHTAVYEGTLAPGRYFLNLFGRSEPTMAGAFDGVYAHSFALFLVPCGGCAPDFNADGSVDPDDLGDFITCYFSEPAGACAGADFNQDGNVDPDDLGDFITSYFAGC